MPHFKLEVTPAVKKEAGWEVTALATVLYGSRPPDPPEEVVFGVNGEEFERTETDPESGIARSVMILQSGGYVVTAIRSRARDRDARRTRSFVIREERELTEDEKKLADLKSKIKLAETEKELKKLTEEKPKKPEEEILESERLELQAEQIRLEKARVVKSFSELEPKPKSQEQEALEREEIELARAKVARQLKQEKKEDKEPTRDEKKTAALKARLERVKAEQELKEAERKEVLRPTDLVIDSIGGNGKYRLFITVLSKEKPESIGVGVPDAIVTVIDRHTGQSWETKTGSSGAAIFEVPQFMEHEKIIAVVVEDLPLKDRQLLGPRTPARP